MRLRTSLVGLIVALLPLTGAQASVPAKPRPPGRSVVIKVSGLPKGAKARITVKGPKEFHKTIKTGKGKTFHKLRPGKYRVAARKVTVARTTWTARVRPRKGKVTKRKGLRVKITYSTSHAKQPPEPVELSLPSEPFAGILAPHSIVLVSGTQAGVVGNRESGWPTWSPGGTSVGFSSCASNLVTPATTNCFVYSRRLSDGLVTRIPNTNLGDDIDMWGGESQWSPDGTQIAFTTLTHLIPADTNTSKDVYVVPVVGGTPTRVSQSLTGTGLSGGPYPAKAEDPRWSPDSSRILFRSGATSLTGDDTDQVYDLFVKTLSTGNVLRIGRGLDAEGGRWSPNGLQIAFTAMGYDPGTEDYLPDIFLAAATGGASSAVTGDNGSSSPTWATGGDRIAFESSSANLVPGDTNESSDVFAKSLASNEVARISVGPKGEQTLWSSSAPVWSPDGTKIAFVAEGGDYGETIVVKNLATGTVTQLAKPTFGSRCMEYEYDPAEGRTVCVEEQDFSYEARDPVWSPDSTKIAFTASFPELVPGDTNETDDVFVATL